ANAIAGQREEAVREIDAAEASYRGGRGAQADVFAARSALIALEDKLADAQNRVRVAGEALARWIGEAAFGPIAGAIDLKSLPPHVAGEHVALEDHPDIQVASRSVDLAQAEVRLAREERNPD